jgi:DNA-binding transcriptional MerR regulator
MNDQTSRPLRTRIPKPTFNFEEFLDAANDAANRTRYVSIVLLVASILIFIGLNNSYLNSWMVDDIRQVYQPGDDYIKGLLDPNGKGKDYFNYSYDYDYKGHKMLLTRPVDVAKRDAQDALIKIHMESRLLLKIPILGLTIHVNDLGFLGGITLIVLLLMLRTSLSREIKNLGYSFKRASAARRLDEFYEALAMRQLFTVPQMKGEKRNRFLSKAPYAVCLLPILVYFLLVAYDIYTAVILPRYKRGFEGELWDVLTTSSILWLMVIEGVCVFIILQIALRCLERQHYLYFIWDSYWELLDQKKDNLCLLEPVIAAHFQRDKNIDIKEIKKILKEEHTKESKELNLPQRFWRAFKEENSPIIRFLFSIQISEQRMDAKPRLIKIDAEIAKLFSNDKQINDTLRKYLEQREKQTDDASAISDEK